MRAFELFEDGRLIPLPDEGRERGVTVFLPAGRQLFGRLEGDLCCWSLWDGRKKTDVLSADGGLVLSEEPEAFILPPAACRQVEDALYVQYPPPGDHCLTIGMLRQICPDVPLFWGPVSETLASLSPNLTSQNGTLQLYWGVRFALAGGRQDIIDRIRLWSLNARDFLNGKIDAQMVLTASQTPPPQLLNGQSLGPQRPVDGEPEESEAGPDTTLLVRYDAVKPFGQTPLSAWFLLSGDLWRHLRKFLSGGEAILCLWGALEAREAWEQSRRYCPPSSEPADTSSVLC
ncbi:MULTISPECIES: hypothetical protein [Jonquetella]|uniref:Uncharacterized protein n=1 Tax=Jonquetella anthropi DSM 22815 TaxID=885272 RepID=H0ULR8_9BACT|nr:MULTISPECIES: hypothetical protein [Jonquetella]EEX48124.1 hypothetical protein GCWU000246_01443 [Jonquetella anthropi E3_33 E1]EHM13559.1 hypothetical protein JonanDRAFT_1193 [Jonquetella anthropi DSM 22815]ERL24392.1 hypothetical protein HMPREF1249_1535 [Jonquetella sp. BV3C21]